VAREEESAEELGFTIAVGSDHPTLERLVEQGDLEGWAPAAGAGTVRTIPDGFDGRDGLVVAGADAAGTNAALDWLGRRAPYLRENERGGYRLHDARTHARRTLQGLTAGGQAALALHKRDSWMRRLAEEGSMAGAPLPSVVGDSASTAGTRPAAGTPVTPSRVEVELAVETAAPGLDEVAEAVVRTHGGSFTADTSDPRERVIVIDLPAPM